MFIKLVLAQHVTSAEGHLTAVAPVEDPPCGRRACVDHHMMGQLVGVTKPLRAQGALMRQLALVRLQVRVQLVPPKERLRAADARERVHHHVGPLVYSDARLQGAPKRAEAAAVGVRNVRALVLEQAGPQCGAVGTGATGEAGRRRGGSEDILRAGLLPWMHCKE